MQIINFKLKENIVEEIDGVLDLFHFNNRTEFIRECIREKLDSMRREAAIIRLSRLKGAAKGMHTDEEFRKLRDSVGEEYLKELDAKFK
jgi:Arc/MetJ-type ribon-helix-helix transcriptional regulator